jgi:hypothetical protein
LFSLTENTETLANPDVSFLIYCTDNQEYFSKYALTKAQNDPPCTNARGLGSVYVPLPAAGYLASSAVNRTASTRHTDMERVKY